ncbi:MAG: hypothetical protein ACPGUV_01250 [Polyangiales bacterium]
MMRRRDNSPHRCLPWLMALACVTAGTCGDDDAAAGEADAGTQTGSSNAAAGFTATTATCLQ